MLLKNRLFLMLAAALLAAPLPSLADPVYTVNFLPDGFEPTALGEHGMIAGRMKASTITGWAAAIYSDGSLTRYDNLGVSSISSINSSGMFTGSLQIGSTDSHAFIFRDGVIQDIGAGMGLPSHGDVINASGQVAVTGINGPYGQTFLYSNGVMSNLVPFGPYFKTWIEDMNDSAVVVGGTEVHNQVHAFMYSNGVMTEIVAPGGGESWAYGINNSGSVVGNLGDYTASHAFLYRDGALLDLGTFGGVRAGAMGIDDSGRVIGFVDTGEGSYGYIYSNGTLVDLNTLVDGANGYAIRSANGINETGQILGYACNTYNYCRRVLLDPVSAVPEPATCAMLLAGLAAIAGRRQVGRRRKPGSPERH